MIRKLQNKKDKNIIINMDLDIGRYIFYNMVKNNIKCIIWTCFILLIVLSCAKFDYKNPVDPKYKKDPPELLSPPDDTTMIDNTPTFTWSADNQATAYALFVDNDVHFSSPEIDQPSITTNTFTPTKPLYNGHYYWRVRARYGEDAWKEWSTVYRITISTPRPSAPTLLIPPDSSLVADDTPDFDWNDVSDASVYELIVDNSVDFSSPEINQSALTQTNYVTENPLLDGHYYWRVRCQDIVGNWGGWSMTWNFTIDTEEPAAPILSVPLDSSFLTDDTPNFDWNDVSDASIYEVQVANSNSFSSLEIYQNSITSSEYVAIKSLSNGTWYYRVRCEDSAGNWSNWSNTWSFTINVIVTDIDGNAYTTVKIGDQWWMAENLKVTRYSNGDMIPKVTSNSEWANLIQGAYCAYDNDENNAETYGYLYNWDAVRDSRNIGPEGWHVPTDEEWKTLEKSLGMSQSEADYTGWRGTDEGSKLAGKTEQWEDGNLDGHSAFGKSGFIALPAGYREGNGYFFTLGHYAYFWSATDYYGINAWIRYLCYNYSGMYRFKYSKWFGFSVRLVRD